MIIEIDGNDGVGKTTYIKELKKLYPESEYEFRDRGLLSKGTLEEDFDRKIENNEEIVKLDHNVCYILLDANVYFCQARIEERGDSIEEEFHNIKDLRKYQRRFKLLVKNLLANNPDRTIPIIDTTYSQDFETNIKTIQTYIFIHKEKLLWKL